MFNIRLKVIRETQSTSIIECSIIYYDIYKSVGLELTGITVIESLIHPSIPITYSALFSE